MAISYPAIENKIERLNAMGTLPSDGVGNLIVNPERLGAELGRTLQYFDRVESEVAADPLYAMFPRLGTEYSGYKSYGREFINIWVPQEQAHGKIFGAILEGAGVGRLPIVDEVAHAGMVGVLGRLSPAFHAVLEHVYVTRGAMHEKLTYIGYGLMEKRLRAMGEIPLAEEVIKPIHKQEAGHLGYYQLAAQTLKSHLSSRQLSLARWISARSYMPVGANKPEHEPHFGYVAGTLAGDNYRKMSGPVQEMADKLLAPDGALLPQFVARALQRCVEADSLLAAA